MESNPEICQMIDEAVFNDFPVAVYLVSLGGNFLYGNRKLRELLHLPLDEDLSSFTITSFYKRPLQRQELLERVLGAERAAESLEKQTANFIIRGRDVVVEIYCQTVKSTDGELAGFRGCIISVTNDERTRALWDLLPVGVFQADGEARFSNVNSALVNFLGYSRREEIEGEKIADFIADKSSVASIIPSIVDERPLDGCVLEMIRRSGEKIFASVSSMPVYGHGGDLNGFEGTIEDVTLREQYKFMLDNLPLGLYVVRVLQGNDVIVHCNDRFAEIFDYSSAREVIGKDIRVLHGDVRSYDEFISKAVEAGRDGRSLEAYRLRTRTPTGRSITIEVNCQVVLDGQGQMVERIGVLRDISDEILYRRMVETFTEDIGNVLHTYSAHLVMLKMTLDPMARSLGRRLEGMGDVADAAALSREVDSAAATFAAALENFIALMRSPRGSLVVSASSIRVVEACQRIARQYKQVIQLEPLRIPALRESAQDILGILETIPRGVFPRELLKAINSVAWRLERGCCLISLLNINEAVSEMEYQVRAFRDYVTRNIRVKESLSTRSLHEVINQALSNIAEFARFRGVDVRRIGGDQVLMRVVERDIVRAISNLLHNAIKYSWGRQGEPPWIFIKCKIEGSEIRIEVENYGVPIPKDEIESGFIFKVGTRGRLASDRGRTGTGIGLADARDVAMRHRGNLFIESRPASGGEDEDYSKPFVTRAVIVLPIGGVEGNLDEA